MSCIHQKVIILDCQTTGMHPKNGHLLQLGWCIYDSKSTSAPLIQRRLVKLPDDATIPGKIIKLLNLKQEELSEAYAPELVLTELLYDMDAIGETVFVLIHYAQFELSFLKHYFLLYLNKSFNCVPICTQKLSKQVFPSLPSHNLKALAGHFKFETPAQEASAHVKTTIAIWKVLKEELSKKNLTEFPELLNWLKTNKNSAKDRSITYNIERLTRLQLPEQPGIYRMIANDGRILYIGKATSLKARVNSYFRGIKNRDKRKLEMLAQVWQIDFVVCDSVLEAELMESDAIKESNPPYNMTLKTEARALLFYNDDFNAYTSGESELFCEGPYRPFNALESLFDLHFCLLSKKEFTFHLILFSAEEVSLSWQFFCKKYKFSLEKIIQATPRQLLRMGNCLLRQFEMKESRYSFEKWWASNKIIDSAITPSPEILADKIWRTFIRAAEAKRRTKDLRLLYQSKIEILSTNQWINLNSHPLNIAVYDKLSILLSAKKKKLIRLVKRD
ncbi:MAG: GIY-YIG nuclease family protein [Tatlockia sp.]|nr:GIY-YIG nuclease family protein [Tatlockia sp.]